MSFRIAIIGGGWYGCHIAASLRALDFDVQLFEARERLLDAASGNNQFRLHLGFHYPRHHTTRVQSRDGFMRFIERYPDLSTPLTENIYAVPKSKSLIDFLTYRAIMTSSGIEFREIDQTPVELRGIEGMLHAPERVLCLERSRQYFSKTLDGRVNFGARIDAFDETAAFVRINGTRFDYVVDATWGHLSPLPINVYYEPTMLLYYECEAHVPALTFVDGPLCSLYPTEDPRICTLSSVPHTPLGQFTTPEAAVARLRTACSADVEIRREKMERQIEEFFPAFRSSCRFLGPQLSIKTKPVGSSDDRSCHVFKAGRTFTVLSGKIDTIFFAVERILALLQISSPDGGSTRSSGLRSDIDRYWTDINATTDPQ